MQSCVLLLVTIRLANGSHSSILVLFTIFVSLSKMKAPTISLLSNSPKYVTERPTVCHLTSLQEQSKSFKEKLNKSELAEEFNSFMRLWQF